MDPLTLANSPQTIAARTATIRQAMLRESRQIRQANFSVVGADDLAMLFRLYDWQFLGGWLGHTVARQADGPVSFRLSSTMTRAGGKTITTRRVGPDGQWRLHHEIAIGSQLLFMTFASIDRPVIVCGLPCGDRLEALMRVFEHEIVHLIELLVWGRSSCTADRFQAMARRVFGHLEATHALVTPREHAAVEHGITVGSMVEFEFQGTRHVGRVNRIHRRATVLVESPEGVPYSDGKRYRKYYVPLEGLRAVT